MYGDRFLREAELHEDARSYKAAFRSLLTGAKLGEASCFVNLGNYYSAGTGTGMDLAKAAYWYRKAYAEGDSSGALNLAIDRKNAGNIRSTIFWLKRSVAMDDGSACIELAKIYRTQRTGTTKAISLLQQVLKMTLAGASELDREDATAMLQEMLQQ